MRVLFACNANNHFFSTVRHLRDVGVDARLLILANEDAIFAPSEDTFDRDYQAYTSWASWGDPMRYAVTSADCIRRDLDDCDFLVGCGSVPAFAHKIRKQLDCFIPYGSDLMELPRTVLQRTSLAGAPSLWQFPRAQAHAIAHARYIGGAIATPFEVEMARLGVKGRRIAVAIPPLYATDFGPDSAAKHYAKSSWFAEFARVRASADVMIMHHARHIWASECRYSALAAKGNDKLIRAFARAVKALPDVRLRLAMFEYGPDVDASVQLVEQLGIATHVAWFPRMGRKEILTGLSLADIACGEFFHSWIFGGTIIESLALAKPLLGHRIDSLYTDTYSELYPMMNAYSEDEIYAQIRAYVDSPEPFRAMGKAGHAWFRTHVIERPLQTLIAMFRGDL